MLTLNNGVLAVEIDDKGRLTRLENLKTNSGNVISRPSGLFRAVLKRGENWEDAAYSEHAHIEFRGGGARGEMRVSKLITRMGEADINIVFTLTLDGEKCLFGAEIDNRSNATLIDFYYPCVGAITSLGDGEPSLLFPHIYGHLYTRIAKNLANMQSWDGQMELTAPYPFSASMQWMTLMDDENCLYLSGRDAQFYASTLRAAGSEREDVTLEFDRMLLVKPGEAREAPGALLWLYNGTWQKGACEYREWAKTWRKPVTPKPWAKDMNGYYLVINKQQYGDEIWRYDEIPELYRRGDAYGCDVLGLFGWYDSGHDNKYPELAVSESMGGEEALKAGIKEVHANGGRVTLYYQGHLIDVETDYYKTVGNKLEGKNRWGTPYYEQFSKYSESDFLRMFSRKVFSTVCPWCEQWHELMAERADWVRSFGADGILYDQIGGMPPTPCFDESHGHACPSISFSQGRVKLLSAIRARLDARGDYAFFTEMISDLYSQYIDVIHGTAAPMSAKAERVIEPCAEPREIVFPEMFRHTFPETISTVRNPRPYLTPRMANYATVYGFRFEIELRYRKDRLYTESDARGEWRDYADKLRAMRMRNKSHLLNGVYSCDESLARANPGVVISTFTSQNTRAWVIWNDTDADKKINLCNYSAARWETAYDAGEGAPAYVRANSLIALFE